MNAIIRHLNSGEHYLATLDTDGDVTHLSAILPIADQLGRDWRESDVTAEQWESFGSADLYPFEDAADMAAWTAEKITVVHEIGN